MTATGGSTAVGTARLLLSSGYEYKPVLRTLVLASSAGTKRRRLKMARRNPQSVVGKTPVPTQKRDGK